MKHFFISICLFWGLFDSLAQSTSNTACSLTPPSIISCTQTSGAINLENAGTTQLSSGTYYFNVTGTQNFPNNFSLNGATLILCGGTINNLNNLNFNNGILIIAPGTTVNHSQSLHVNGGNGILYNYGRLNVQNSLVIQARGLYNHLGAIITANNIDVNSNTRNLGQIQVNERIDIKGSGRICASDGSYISTKHAYNDGQNAIAVPTGYSCFSYSASFGGNNSIAATNNLYLCRKQGASAPVNNSAGQSSLINNCENCAIPLNIELHQFDYEQFEQSMYFKWTMTISNDYARIELNHFDDWGVSRNVFTKDVLQANKTEKYEFRATDELVSSLGNNYYQLIGVRKNGEREILKTVSTSFKSTQKAVIYPNPAIAHNPLSVHLPNYDIQDRMSLEVYSIIGNKILDIDAVENTNLLKISLDSGQYRMLILKNGEVIEVQTIIVF